MHGHAPDSRPPQACGVAFKEWASICHAISEGRQSLIFRKGGIAEDSGSFRPEHPAFWLYPTAFHQPDPGYDRPEPDRPPGSISLGTLAVVDVVAWANDLARLAALRPLHTWEAEVVHKKFHYRKPGLWVLGVRAFARAEPWRLPADPRYDGCKTWVELNLQLSCEGLVPVLGEPEHARRMGEIRSALDRLPEIGS